MLLTDLLTLHEHHANLNDGVTGQRQDAPQGPIEDLIERFDAIVARGDAEPLLFDEEWRDGLAELGVESLL